MTEKEEKILKTLNKVLPKLSPEEQERLLAFGEGMAFVKGRKRKSTSDKPNEKVS